MACSTPAFPPSPTPRGCSNSCSSSQWCHPTISSSVIPFSSCLKSFPELGSFLMSPFFKLGGQSIGASASASVLPVHIQDWFPLGWTGWISLLSKGLSRVFSNTPTQFKSINSKYQRGTFNNHLSTAWDTIYILCNSPVLKCTFQWFWYIYFLNCTYI